MNDIRSVNVKIMDKNGEYKTYSDITSIVLETDTEPQIFSMGEITSASIDLDFTSSDTQEVTASDTELYDSITINKPENLVSENIASGIIIAGITGSFEGKGDMPTLNKVTISRNGNTITITNPSSNGSFVEKYLIYDNDELIIESTSNTFKVTDLNISGENNISVSSYAKLFNESSKSSTITVILYLVTYDTEYITTSSKNNLVVENLDYSNTLVAEDNMALPEDIEITVNDEDASFTYNSYTGDFSVSNVTGNVRVSAFADSTFHIRRPKVSLSDEILTFIPERYSEYTIVYANDEEIYRYENIFSYEVKTITGATYSFTLNQDNYYESNNKGIANSYAIARVYFNSSSDITLTINFINYAESAYDYGIVSNINSSLLLSNADDSSSNSANVYKSFKGSSSSSIQALTISVPAGESFVDIKYRKDSSVNSYNDSLQFMIMEV